MPADHALQPPRVANPQRFWIRFLGSVPVWIFGSLLFVLLMRLTQPGDGASRLWWIDPALSVVFLALYYADKQWNLKQRWRPSPIQAAALIFTISWINSMLYELTISHFPGKFGGMHKTTVGSFVIAQGYYVPMALIALWMIRRFHLSFHRTFFMGGMTSFYEATTVGLITLISPLFFLSPIVIAYYFVVYTRFLSMGLLLVDERVLWSEQGRTTSFLGTLLLGVGLCLVCWIIFALWGLLMIWLFQDFEAYALTSRPSDFLDACT